MAGTLNVTCGGCQAKYQVPPVLAGKKIRCKGCGAAIAVPAGVKAAKPVAAAKPVGAKPGAKPAAEAPKPNEEWNATITAYDVIKEKDNPRCPHCAHDMDDEEIVCLNCGYNTITREKLPNRVLEPVTGGDYFIWLLPGFLCILMALFGIFWLQMMFTHVPYISALDWMYFTKENKAVPVYLAVACAFDIWGFGYFGVKRLVFNPHPPDKDKVMNDKADDE